MSRAPPQKQNNVAVVLRTIDSQANVASSVDVAQLGDVRRLLSATVCWSGFGRGSYEHTRSERICNVCFDCGSPREMRKPLRAGQHHARHFAVVPQAWSQSSRQRRVVWPAWWHSLTVDFSCAHLSLVCCLVPGYGLGLRTGEVAARNKGRFGRGAGARQTLEPATDRAFSRRTRHSEMLGCGVGRVPARCWPHPGILRRRIGLSVVHPSPLARGTEVAPHGCGRWAAV